MKDTWGVLGLHFKLTRGAWSYGSNFFSIDSWGLFTFNVCLRKNLSVGDPNGSPKWGRQLFFLPKIFDLRLYMNDRDIILVKRQILDPQLNNTYQVFQFKHLLHSITAPSKTHSFWQFFEFSRKTRDIFPYFFDIMGSFIWFVFPVLSRGQIFFH